MVCQVSPPSESVCDVLKQATSPPSSPPISPPGLLQSSSSSTANPQLFPHTPPRGRSRYPASLAQGPRVPLHRRGTSKTYERLEDLLQEAGYKETRIFTPETERLCEYERGQGERRQMNGRVRSGMDTVVGFLAGLVMGQADKQHVDNTQTEQMVRPSPLDPPTSDGESLRWSRGTWGPHSSLQSLSRCYYKHESPLPNRSDLMVYPTASAPRPCRHLLPELICDILPLPQTFRGVDFQGNTRLLRY